MVSYISLYRNYYGSKIAMYFAWLGFYTQMLVVPSILGLIIFIYGVAYMDMLLMISYIFLSSGTTMGLRLLCTLPGWDSTHKCWWFLPYWVLLSSYMVWLRWICL